MNKKRMNALASKRFDQKVSQSEKATIKVANVVVERLGDVFDQDQAKGFIGFAKDQAVHNKIVDYADNKRLLDKLHDATVDNYFIKKIGLSNFIARAGESDRASAALGFARIFGGKALFATLIAGAGVGPIGRYVVDHANEGFIGQMNSTLQMFMGGPESHIFTTSILAVSFAATLFLGKSLYTNWSYRGAVNFERDRVNHLAENLNEQGFVTKILNFFKSNYEAEKEMSKDLHGRLVNMKEKGASITDMIRHLKEKDMEIYRHINRTALKLQEDYRVEPFMSHQHALNMLIEVNGDTNLLTARLQSRRISNDWIVKYDLDRNTVHPTAPKPSKIEEARQGEEGLVNVKTKEVDSFVSKDVVLLNESHRVSYSPSGFNKKLNEIKRARPDDSSGLNLGN